MRLQALFLLLLLCVLPAYAQDEEERVHRDEILGFSFRYPKTCVLVSDPKLMGQVRDTVKEWLQQRPDLEKVAARVGVSLILYTKSGKGGPNLAVTTELLPTPTEIDSSEKFAKAAVAGVRTLLPGVAILEGPEPVDLGGHELQRVVMGWTLDGVEMRITQYLYFRPDRSLGYVFAITRRADSEEEAQEILEGVLRTLQFEGADGTVGLR